MTWGFGYRCTAPYRLPYSVLPLCITLRLSPTLFRTDIAYRATLQCCHCWHSVCRYAYCPTRCRTDMAYAAIGSPCLTPY
eukprot:3941587-Rhodomonas_salina.2